MPALTDVDICSNAAVRLGSDSFDSFDAETNAATASANIYPRIKASLLSRHNWHFASKFAQLSQDAGTPSAKWTYQYILPTDRLGNAPVEVFLASSSVPTPYKDWEIAQGYLMSDASELWCKYTYDVDEADMPDYFVELLIKAMMLELCIPLLGKDSLSLRATLQAEVWAESVGEFQKAKTADSRNHPPISSTDFDLLTARHGGQPTRWV